MALVDTILADIKEAMKAHDSAAVTALRGLNAQIKDATVNAGKTLDDAAVVQCVNKAIKQREDSIAQYQVGGREDLVAKERAELELIRKYQPKQMDEEEIRAIVTQTIAETGVTSLKEKGKFDGGAHAKSQRQSRWTPRKYNRPTIARLRRAGRVRSVTLHSIFCSRKNAWRVTRPACGSTPQKKSALTFTFPQAADFFSELGQLGGASRSRRRMTSCSPPIARPSINC